MAKRDHCRVGTRDYCTECGKIIELKRSEYRSDVWHHVDPDDLEFPARCINEDFTGKDGTFWSRSRAANPKNFCWESIETSWYSDRCTRPVTNLEFGMCGIHGNAEKKRTQRQRENEQRRELSAWVSQEVGALMDRMKEEYDLDAELHYNSSQSTYSGKIIVDPVKLMEILEQTDEEF